MSHPVGVDATKDQLNFEIFIERIKQALSSAKLGVECDSKADYANAILNYKGLLSPPEVCIRSDELTHRCNKGFGERCHQCSRRKPTTDV